MPETFAKVLTGDCIEMMQTMDNETINACVTSPPYYWQRDYGFDGQLGHEPTPNDFVEALVAVFREVRRVLRDDGTLWLNLGDSYYNGNGQPKGRDPRSPSRDWIRKKVRPLDVGGLGYPKKSLLGMPWRVALALQDDGWTLRQEIVWCRDTAFPEPSVKDRPHRQHETIFLFSKARWYHFNRAALPEQSVWHIPHERRQRKHCAPFPEELARRCIEAGCPKGGKVLDPFGGSGTTAVAANQTGRSAILCEANPEFADASSLRINAALATEDMFR